MNFLKPNFSLESFLKIFFPLFLFLLPWQTILIVQKWELGNVGIFGFEMVFWIVGILFLFWFFRNKDPSSSATGRTPQDDRKRLLIYSIFLFLIYCFFSTLWSPNPTLAFFQAFRLVEAFLLIWILLSFPFNIFQAMYWFIAGAVIQSLLGMYQFLTQSTFTLKWLGLVSHPLWETGTSVVQSLEAGRWLRAYGAFPHPNVFGGYLVVGIVLTTVLLIWENYSTKQYLNIGYWILPARGWSAFGGNIKILFLIFSLFLQITALFFTFSRSAWIAVGLFFVSLLVYSLLSKKVLWLNYKRNILRLCCCVGVLLCSLASLYFPLVKTRLMAESFHETRAIEERLSGPKVAWELLKSSPILGVGAGNYVAALLRDHPDQPLSFYQPVHIVPLLMLVELGVVGFLLLFIPTFLFFLTHLKYFHQFPNFLISLFPLLFLDHYLYSLPIGIFLLAISLGIILRFSTPFPQENSV